MNKLSSYIDGSVVYGESEERNRVLREFKDGKMKVGSADLLPVSQRLKLEKFNANYHSFKIFPRF